MSARRIAKGRPSSRTTTPATDAECSGGDCSEPIRSTGKGEAFVIATGLPVSHRSKSAAMSWYTFAVEYVDARWAQLGGNSRKNIAKALTATTVALLRTQRGRSAPGTATARGARPAG
ncbi:hypothetical protein [Streptomyces sp. IBSBF 2390]|uniref:hypothetical protein n=1 Tax=Streptomyces sp. IBSBF 2390 TaxID=2903533 RepID=UPI002FDBC553